ncbi:MAG: ugpC 2 [Microvirga sp.]|jgi:ABC-type sugar transport system ATPase subunit|nr:ugpC 2 [Microvirga sp.]MDF2970862.1 ugpC 2 [Microvirga sp.]
MDVSLEAINKSFGSVRVLKDVSLQFPSRKFVTLLGPSGCGKTTLLRMIAGLEIVDSGIIRFGEKVVNRLAPRDRNIAMVFQSYALYPQMSVGQNLAYGLRVRGTPKEARTEAVARVARILEIDHLLDRRPAQLSGGQRQRVALGRAMVRKPDIFLMDEPLSNLDARLRITMRAELRRFHLDLGATTVYVTHDQLEAMTMSDHVAVMNGGVVQQFGTPAQVYGHPANLFVAGFIGSPPMNLIRGVVEADNGLPTFASEHARVSLPHLAHRLHAGQRVVLGARPQDLRLVPSAAEGSAHGRVWVVELVGSEKLVDVDLGDKRRLTVQVRADAPILEDEAVHVGIEASDVHVFDAESGQRVSGGEAVGSPTTTVSARSRVSSSG